MWKDYIKEREGLETYESEKGFLTYEINNGLCFMSDIYVKPEFRGTTEGFRLFQAVKEIAVSEGCTQIHGQVDTNCNGHELSLNLMKRLGFKPFHEEGTVMYLQLKLYTVRGTNGS